MRNDPLFEPFQLKHLRLKNRIVSTPHAPAYAEEGLPKQRYQLYHEEKAKGGLAMTMFGGSSCVGPDSPSVFGQLYVGDDRIIPYFQEFSKRIHQHVMIQEVLETILGAFQDRGGAWYGGEAPANIPVHENIAGDMGPAAPPRWRRS